MNNGLTRCFERELLRHLLDFKEIYSDASASSGAAYLQVAVVIGYARNTKPSQRLDIAYEAAVGRRDHHVLDFVVDR